MPLVFTTTANACDREAAWLNTTGDGLPALPVSAGGKWQIVEAYWPRTPPARRTSIYVTRPEFDEDRRANQRVDDRYALELRLIWPLSSGAGNAQADQRAFDVAIDDVLTRVRGYLGDKTHRGAFLSAAELPRQVKVRYADPEVTMRESADFRAFITYFADDFEITA